MLNYKTGGNMADIFGDGLKNLSTGADAQKQKEALAKKTNQDIINAVYKLADQFNIKGGPWPLLRAIGWGKLGEKRADLYKGPSIDEIEGLTHGQKEALKTILGI
jgi:hypothetical protein